MFYKLNEFGERAKKIRKSLKLSQKNVRDYVGINEDTLRRLESGRTLATIETLDLLSLVYKCDMNVIFSDYKLTFDQYFESRIGVILPHIRKYDYDQLKKEADLFLVEFQNFVKIKSSILENKSKQYFEYLKALSNLQNSFYDESRNDITNLINVLNCDYNVLKNSKESIILDKLEIRIFILVSIIYRYRNEFEKSIFYLKSALSALQTRYSKDKDYLYFYFLINTNLLTHYHRVDDFEELDRLYKENLLALEDNIGITMITSLLIRAGINKHQLGLSYGKAYICTALTLLKDAGYEERSDDNFKKFKKLYPEIFEESE